MSDEELSQRHRRASEAAAGAPSAATRAAIRREAEAQAAARRAVAAAPAAANEAHWPLRAVATLAVVAIAAGLWWQMRPELDRQLTGDSQEVVVASAPSAAPAPAAAAAVAPAVADGAGAVAEAPLVAANRALEPSLDMAQATSQESLLPAMSASAPAMAMRAAAPPAAAKADAAVTADAAVKADTAARAEAASMSAASDTDLAGMLGAVIARQLPEVWNSAAPVPGVWARVGAAGEIVEVGRDAGESRLAAGRTATALPEAVEVPNARGITLRVVLRRGVARP